MDCSLQRQGVTKDASADQMGPLPASGNFLGDTVCGNVEFLRAQGRV